MPLSQRAAATPNRATQPAESGSIAATRWFARRQVLSIGKPLLLEKGRSGTLAVPERLVLSSSGEPRARRLRAGRARSPPLSSSVQHAPAVVRRETMVTCNCFFCGRDEKPTHVVSVHRTGPRCRTLLHTGRDRSNSLVRQTPHRTPASHGRSGTRGPAKGHPRDPVRVRELPPVYPRR